VASISFCASARFDLDEGQLGIERVAFGSSGWTKNQSRKSERRIQAGRRIYRRPVDDPLISSKQREWLTVRCSAAGC
jgi:hypothetical protein